MRIKRPKNESTMVRSYPTRSATKNKGKKRNLAKMQGSKNGKLGGAREGKEHSTALMKSKNDADQSRSVQDGKS